MRHCTGTGVVIPELRSDFDDPLRVTLHDPAVDAGSDCVGAGVKPLWNPRRCSRLAVLGKIRRRVTIGRHLQSSQPEMRNKFSLDSAYDGSLAFA